MNLREAIASAIEHRATRVVVVAGLASTCSWFATAAEKWEAITALVAALGAYAAIEWSDWRSSVGRSSIAVAPLGDPPRAFDVEFAEALRDAREVKMCGWGLGNTILAHKAALMKVSSLEIFTLKKGVARRLDPYITAHDPRSSPAHEVGQDDITWTQNDIERMTQHLSGFPNKVRIFYSPTLLPAAITLAKSEDGRCWASVAVYTLNPNQPFKERLTFKVNDPSDPVWANIEGQFEALALHSKQA